MDFKLRLMLPRAEHFNIFGDKDKHFHEKMIFFDDNEGQPWTITFGNKIEMLSLLSMLS